MLGDDLAVSLPQPAAQHISQPAQAIQSLAPMTVSFCFARADEPQRHRSLITKIIGLCPSLLRACMLVHANLREVWYLTDTTRLTRGA
jgi:hypothetical protein